jgi:hypothetical protein
MSTMIECRHCREVLSGEPDRYGARCPRCREPLYERAASQWPTPAEAAADAARCVLHPNNVAVGPCGRCGNFMCGVCRTRWQERPICLACIERALDLCEAKPEQIHSHRRQATLALVFGIMAWALVLVGSLPLLAAQAQHSGAAGLAILAGLFTLISLLPALLGVGQGASAIRARGERMIPATFGLILCGAHLGVMMGMMLFAVWAT